MLLSNQRFWNSTATRAAFQVGARFVFIIAAFLGVLASWRFRFGFVVAALALAASAHAELPEIGLTINGHKLTAEVARTDSTRMEGLMHRRMLPENRGMLFVFRETALHSMWMMNTYIPLSVAFLDTTGAIINIEDMEPHTRDTHPAAKPAKYALEVNRGWFRKRGIKPGARVEGIERAPPAQ